MAERSEAIILMGPPGSGKSFLGNHLARSYREQLAGASLPVAFESAGVIDRPLLEPLLAEHRIAIVHVATERALCVERVISRPRGKNFSQLTDPEPIGRYYDFWYEEIAPGYDFALRVSGADVDAASDAIRTLLAAES